MAGEVYLVYLQMTDQHLATGLPALRKVAARLFPGARQTVVIVDNAVEGDLEILTAEGHELIAGDNRCREFTGYEKGLRHLERTRRLRPDSPVLFANDTFHRHYGKGYLAGFTRARAKEALSRHGILGYVDRYPASVRLGDDSFREWVRTSLFLVDYATAGKLRPFALDIPDGRIFSKRFDRFFRDTAPLSENYRRYLRTWLFEAAPTGSDFVETWHSKEKLTPETFPGLKAKARCILSEHRLAARAAKLGIPLVDTRRRGAVRLKDALKQRDVFLPYVCNICGAPNVARVRRLDRESASCWRCKSNVRLRSVVHVLSERLFGRSLPVLAFPSGARLKGVGLSDWDGYAKKLARALDYENTFLHREPKLDITALSPSREGTADFLISSDVFEHVARPVGRAFQNSFRLLKPGGVLVLTVPFSLEDTTREHFPELHDFRLEERDGKRVLVDRLPSGEEQAFDDLVFHGGDGATLEMRLFSLKGLMRELEAAGFTDVRVHGEPQFKYGIYHAHPWSLPLSAVKPASA